MAGSLGTLVGLPTLCLALVWSVFAEPEFYAAALAGLVGSVKTDLSPLLTALFNIGASASVLGFCTWYWGEHLRGFVVKRACHQLLAADPRLLAPRTRRNPHAWLVRVSRDVGSAYGGGLLGYKATPAAKERLCQALADLYRTYDYAWSDHTSLYLPEAQSMIWHCRCRGHAEHVSMITAALGSLEQRGQPGRRQG